MPEVPTDELNQLPYYDAQPLAGRVVQLRSFYDHDDDEWHLYHPVSEGELGRIAGGEVVRGTYFAERPFDPAADVGFPLGTFVARFASWQDVAIVTGKMETDILQLASLFGKLDLILKSDSLGDTKKSALLESELEHLVTLSRSFYDLLQKFSKRLTFKVRDPEDRESRVFQDLPDGFADIALHGDQPLSAGEISERYGLPDELAEFYASEAKGFAALRNIRDGLVHHGKRAPNVYMLDEGPAIDVRAEQWSDLPVWKETELRREKFGSVRALLAHHAQGALSIPTRYLEAFAAQIAVPPPLIANVSVYLRGPYTHTLNSLDEMLVDPWIEEPG